MAAKVSLNYKCSECDTVSPTWSGRCPACGEWGSLEKFESSGGILDANLKTASAGNLVSLDSIKDKKLGGRFRSGLDEIDRCLGGGVVPGSVILLGGDPGVGKSTLALQLAFGLLQRGLKVLYIAGEESPAQIRLRADRLNGDMAAGLEILADTNLQTILATAITKKWDFLILDSIQTVYNPQSSGVPGSVSQVSGAGARMVELAKQHNIAMLLIGHVTKEGYIAGPKTLEHVVDVVLYLEGERFHHLRLLRAVKNRFGAVNEVGVFEMAGLGLIQVSDPSHLFWDEGLGGRSGAALLATLEGSRVIICEIQALLSKSSLAYPKRTAIGIDLNRLWLILAVVGRYAKLPVFENDVYVNVVGGLKVNEPAADLAVTAAMVSSLLDKPLGGNVVILGELGLSGEIRPVSQIDKRLGETEKLGFKKAVISARQKIGKTNLEVVRAGDINEFLQKIFGPTK